MGAGRRRPQAKPLPGPLHTPTSPAVFLGLCQAPSSRPPATLLHSIYSSPAGEDGPQPGLLTPHGSPGLTHWLGDSHVAAVCLGGGAHSPPEHRPASPSSSRGLPPCTHPLLAPGWLGPRIPRLRAFLGPSYLRWRGSDFPQKPLPTPFVPNDKIKMKGNYLKGIPSKSFYLYSSVHQAVSHLQIMAILPS